MKNKAFRVVALLCMLVLVFQFLPMQAEARSITDVQKEIEEQKNHLKDLQNQITANKANKAAYEAAIAEYQQSLDGLVALIDEQGKLVESTEADLQAKSDQLSDANVRIQSNRELYTERLRAIYAMNSTNAMLANILSVADYSEFVQVSDGFKRISQRDTAVLEQLAAERAQLEQTKLELEATVEELTAVLTQLNENKQWTVDEINRLNGLIGYAEIQIAQSLEESAETEEEIRALQAEYQRIFNESAQKGSKAGDGSVRYAGQIKWPVPASNRVTSWYGDPRSNTRGHYGIDIAAGEGTPIVAAAAGTVITSEWHYSYGWYVVVDHGGGFRTLYAHCYQQGIAAGSYVQAGDTIAGVGNTGNSFGAHLHFEVHDGGSRQDPAGANYLGIY